MQLSQYFNSIVGYLVEHARGWMVYIQQIHVSLPLAACFLVAAILMAALLPGKLAESSAGRKYNLPPKRW